MNQRKAKQLMREARLSTVGMSNTSYAKGWPTQLMTNCTRFVYKKLKQNAKNS